VSTTEVYDGWAHFSCRIETRINRRGRRQWRWVCDRRFVITKAHRSGQWGTNEENVRRDGMKHLVSHSRKRYETVDTLTARQADTPKEEGT
jgi:hypothetical protein